MNYTFQRREIADDKKYIYHIFHTLKNIVLLNK